MWFWYLLFYLRFSIIRRRQSHQESRDLFVALFRSRENARKRVWSVKTWYLELPKINNISSFLFFIYCRKSITVKAWLVSIIFSIICSIKNGPKIWQKLKNGSWHNRVFEGKSLFLMKHLIDSLQKNFIIKSRHRIHTAYNMQYIIYINIHSRSSWVEQKRFNWLGTKFYKLQVFVIVKIGVR